MKTPRSLRNKLLPIAVITVAALLPAGCSSTGSTTSAPSPSTTVGDEAAVIQAHNVEIVGFRFLPDVQTISRGTTISWINKDPYSHTVTSGDTGGQVNKPDGTFDEDLEDQGDIINITFDEPGTFSYYCKQHNAMNAEIRVS